MLKNCRLNPVCTFATEIHPLQPALCPCILTYPPEHLPNHTQTTHSATLLELTKCPSVLSIDGHFPILTNSSMMLVPSLGHFWDSRLIDLPMYIVDRIGAFLTCIWLAPLSQTLTVCFSLEITWCCSCCWVFPATSFVFLFAVCRQLSSREEDSECSTWPAMPTMREAALTSVISAVLLNLHRPLWLCTVHDRQWYHGCSHTLRIPSALLSSVQLAKAQKPCWG